MSEQKVGGPREQREAASAERRGPSACERDEGLGRGRRQMADREARLAAQLRENLKKRKALARSRQHAERED